jgi:hypothetical protein
MRSWGDACRKHILCQSEPISGLWRGSDCQVSLSLSGLPGILIADPERQVSVLASAQSIAPMKSFRQESTTRQTRKEMRRHTKDALLRVYALARQTLYAADPHLLAADPPHWRRQMYRELRAIFKALGTDETAHHALFELECILTEIAGYLEHALTQRGIPPTRLPDPNSADPAPTPTTLADEMIKLIGSTGLARADALDRALKARGIRAANARDILRAGALLEADVRWVEPYRRDGKEVHYRPGRRGRAIRLWLLTAHGRARYRTLTGNEPVESELFVAMRQPGASLAHALGIIELAEALERLGCTVDRQPAPILLDPGALSPVYHTPHLVPDLVIRQAPPNFLPNGEPACDLIVEYETNGNAAGSHAEQWAKRARRLGVCAIVLPNPEQVENMRLELTRAQVQPVFGGLTLRVYLTNLADLLKGELAWEVLVLHNSGFSA